MGELRVVAAIKPVAPVTSVDWLTGEVGVDRRHLERTAGDEAACRVALDVARALGARAELVAVAGPGCEPLLRELVGEGFSSACRVAVGEADHESAAVEDQLQGAAVAQALAEVLAGPDVVVCGEASGDRGSATVPSRLAEHLGCAQALGVHDVSVHGGVVCARRRLDGGHVERLSVPRPCVLSVLPRAGTAPRAPLGALLSPGGLEVLRVAVEGAARGEVPGTVLGPWRPPSSGLAAPGEPEGIRRALEVTGATTRREPPEVVRAEPHEAARAILDRLGEWGLR